MLTFNEGKVCEAIIRHLEARDCATRAEVHSPEAVNHDNPVELVFKLGARLFALEHTGIEPFDDHMRLEAEAERHFDPIKEAVADLLPDDVLEIHVSAKAMLRRKPNEIAKIQKSVIGWVRQTAQALKLRTYADYLGDIEWNSIEGVPFKLRLFRFRHAAGQHGRVQIVHLVEGDRDKQRTERLRRACDKKFPKLAAWKKDCGARSVLVLEENDIQLTNYAIVAERYLPLALARADRPDETYLVSTCIEPWSVWPILIDDKTLHDLAVDDYVQRWDIDPMQLWSATER
jgi:hypothetical protein